MMPSKIYIAAAEEIGDAIATVIRDGRAAGVSEAVLAHHVGKLFDSAASEFPIEAFEEIKWLALEHAGRETSRLHLQANIKPLQ